VGAETKYSINQVTVNLRSVDVRTGQVVNSVSVTKTLFSHEISSSIYKYISYKTLLQAEGGYSTNEPSQLAVKEAIETAVIHLTLQGIASRVWSLKNEQDWYLPTVQNYMREAELQLADPESPPSGQNTTVSMRDPTLIRPPQLPLHLQAAAVEQPTLPPVPPAAPAVTGRAAPVTPRFAAVAPAAPAVPAAQAATTAVSAPASPSAPKPQPMIPAAVPQVPVSSVEAPSRPAVQVDMDTSPNPSAPAPAALVSKAPEGPEPLLQAAQPPKGAAPTGQAKAAPTVPPMPATRPRFAPLHTTIPELDDDSNLGFFVISAL
jgi:hypothetical protein